MYPYRSVSTILSAVAAFPGIDMETVFIANAQRSSGEMWEEIIGMSVSEVGRRWGMSERECLDKIIHEDPSTMGVGELMSEEDVEAFLKEPWISIGSDGIEDKEGNPHPRVTGTFPRVLGRYVREKKLMSLGEAVAKMTGLPATRLMLRERGFIRKRFFADITLFDPDTVLDASTYTEPHLPPKGIPHVMVNGQWALEDGEITESRGGRAIRQH